ncbi:hypothetical protein L6452_12958 [Arctium lappa]|uniref:Uncharacterized protein n=1 Tax=Arctium lappa TaxID=4217 RepID=A0ACB9CGY6_ARCLA|nr:hypothetical protein L6452_12958 [Arctium lappa]
MGFEGKGLMFGSAFSHCLGGESLSDSYSTEDDLEPSLSNVPKRCHLKNSIPFNTPLVTVVILTPQIRSFNLPS